MKCLPDHTILPPDCRLAGSVYHMHFNLHCQGFFLLADHVETPRFERSCLDCMMRLEDNHIEETDPS
jgi:hypothetical protein